MMTHMSLPMLTFIRRRYLLLSQTIAKILSMPGGEPVDETLALVRVVIETMFLMV